MSNYFQRILIIDDDAVDRFILRNTIQRNSISDAILEAETGVEALEMITDYSIKGERLPDLIFLDINMPLLDGFGFLEVLEQHHGQYNKRFHIVVICSIRDEKDKQRALKHECVLDYIVKPVLDEDILRLTDWLSFTQTG